MTTLPPGTEVEAHPVDPFDVATKGYVDTGTPGHEDPLDGTEPGPTISVRPGVRAAFVFWSGLGIVVSGHGYYQVQMATDAGFTAIVDDIETKSNWATFDGLTTSTAYHWRVRAVDASGTASAWTTTAATDAPDPVDEPDIADDAVTTTKIRDANITTAKIGDAQISAAKIAALTAQDVIVGANSSDTTGVIKSAGYVPGTAGWRIRGSGDAELNNVTVRGTIDASTITGSDLLVTTEDPVEVQWYGFEIDTDGIINFQTGATEGALAPALQVYSVWDVDSLGTGIGGRITTNTTIQRDSSIFGSSGGGSEIVLTDLYMALIHRDPAGTNQITQVFVDDAYIKLGSTRYLEIDTVSNVATFLNLDVDMSNGDIDNVRRLTSSGDLDIIANGGNVIVMKADGGRDLDVFTGTDNAILKLSTWTRLVIVGSSGGGLRVQNPDGSSWRPVEASAFTVSSDRRRKRDFKQVDDDVLAAIRAGRGSVVQRFRREADDDLNDPQEELGLIAQAVPREARVDLSEEKDGSDLGVDLSAMMAFHHLALEQIEARLTEAGI